MHKVKKKEVLHKILKLDFIGDVMMTLVQNVPREDEHQKNYHLLYDLYYY